MILRTFAAADLQYLSNVGREPQVPHMHGTQANRSSLSPLTPSPVTPGGSQSSGSLSKRTRLPKTISPRKRLHIDSDSDYIAPKSTHPSQSTPTTRIQHQRATIQHAAQIIDLSDSEYDDVHHPHTSDLCGPGKSSALPIEILDSSEDELLIDQAVHHTHTSLQHPVSSAASKPRPRPVKKAHIPAAKTTSNSQYEPTLQPRHVSRVEPPPELAKAFQILWNERRIVSLWMDLEKKQLLILIGCHQIHNTRISTN